MTEVEKCIESLQSHIDRLRHRGLKEYSARTILIDPLLQALGWDVRDPDVVELEYPTVDGKPVDYALKINRKPVRLIEAKQLGDPLDDVKAITQVVGYAANDGIDWCILTNGVRYRVYSASQLAAAPEKLLFEVSIDPRENTSAPIEQTASQLCRLSCESLARGVLDDLGEEIFTMAKVRKALNQLFSDPPKSLIRALRQVINDNSVTPTHIKKALAKIMGGKSREPTSGLAGVGAGKSQSVSGGARHRVYDEARHTTGRPQEVVELYRDLDRFCHDLAPGEINRVYPAQYVSWLVGKRIFCCADLQQSGLRVWLTLRMVDIPSWATFARDVSKVGHWGTGDVELAIDSASRLRTAEPLIRRSFERTSSRR